MGNRLHGYKRVVGKDFREIGYTHLEHKISLAAMHIKKMLSEKVVLIEQSYNVGLVNNLEQLSHIAIVSFYKGTTI